MRALVPAVFLATAVAFTAPALLTGGAYAATDIIGYATPWQDTSATQLQPGNPLQTDQFSQLPFVLEFWRGVRDGRLQLWEPDVAGGVPLFTGLHNRVLTPWYAALAVLPEARALTVGVVVALVVAQLGAYGLARRLGVGRGAALLAGVAYAYSGPVVTLVHRLNEVFLFPALLWAVHGAVTDDARRGRFLAATALLTAALWFCGFPAATLFSLYTAAPFALYLAWRRGRPLRGVVPVGAALAAGTAIAAVQLLPTVEFLAATTGLDRRFPLSHGLGLVKLATAVSARFFGAYEDGDWWWPQEGMANPAEASSTVGLVVLALLVTLAAGVRARRHPAEHALGRFLLPAGLVVLAGAYLAGPALAALHLLPYLERNSFVRARFVLALVLAVAAAVALDRLLRRGDQRPSPWVRVPVAVVLVAVAVGVGQGLAAAAREDVVVPVLVDLAVPVGALAVAAGGLLLARRRPAVTVLLVLAAATVELQWGSWGFTPASPAWTVAPRHPALATLADDVGPGGRWRLAGRSTDVLGLNTAAVLDLRDVRGDWPVYEPYEQLLRAADPELPDDPYRASFTAEFSDRFDVGSGALDAAALRYLVTATDAAPLDTGTPVVVPVPTGPLPATVEVRLPPAGLRAVGVQLAPTDPSCTRGWVELHAGGASARRLLRETDGPAGFVLPDLAGGGRLRLRLDTTHCPATVVARDALLLPPGQRLRVVGTGPWVVYERRGARPRVEVANDTVRIDDPARRLARIAARPASGPVVVAGSDVRSAGGRARLVADRPDEVVVAVDAPARGLLVLRDVAAPGWLVAVDGQPAEMVPADHAFRGVAVPAGRSTVTFTYRPASLRVGAASTALGLMAVWAFAATDLLRRRPDPPGDVVS